ncbi:RNA-directed DNA polymerase [Sphingomonas sp. CFBP9019]|uniref:RNA-directed DNA polymerase n=1 Tax=Sphingomonas sp. CFBP9019 TaxID=3096532 RepID=UPI002A6B6D89|nr:RNA-directed DNA polymerase [Sphingomonas sp. CFBP9019]MDY1008790.1 RNA-directed DNA polymerase [Sphingomonas sp. CFBP9019]
MDEDALIDALLGHGYLPKELPPPFTSASLARNIGPLSAAWRGYADGLPAKEKRNYPFPSHFGRFDMARKGHSRRMLAIPNPVNQYHLVQTLANNWDTVRAQMTTSAISMTPALVTPDDSRAVPMPKLALLAERRIKAYATSRATLQTDVLSFYHAIYTHSIPWALHGKRDAKRNRRDTGLLGNRLDFLMRGCQDGQTIGIPVGPDSSRIISELILCAVERDIDPAISALLLDGYRYVDDFFLAFNSNVDAERYLSALRGAILNYDLQLNASKTAIAAALEFNEASWPGTIASLSLASSPRDQRRDIMRFFTEAIDLSKSYPDESIASYSVRTTSRILIQRENWDLYESFLLRVVRENSSCLDAVVKIICTYAAAGYPIGATVNQFVERMIEDHAPYNHHYEVAWVLWLCRSLEIKLSERATALVGRVENSICACLTLMLRSRRLLTGRGAVSDWMGAANDESLRSEYWMLVYEAGIRKTWLVPGAREAVQADPHFRAMRDIGISFFDNSTTNLPLNLPAIGPKLQANLNGRRSAILPGAIEIISSVPLRSRRYETLGEDYGSSSTIHDWRGWAGIDPLDDDDEPDDEVPF